MSESTHSGPSIASASAATSTAPTTNLSPGSSRTVVIAPDSFKGTATAIEVAAAIAAGWTSRRRGDRVLVIPMADGGEGTLDAFESAWPGAQRRPVTVDGPDGRPVAANWLLLPDGTGVVELANTSGLPLLDELIPHDATSTGFGQAIAAALDAGVGRLVLAIGGSSSTDGGVGALTALGATFRDDAGVAVRPGNRGLATLAAVGLDSIRSLPPGGAVVLGDVTNPLLGPLGAAAVFGPQKGATVADVAVLDANLARLASLVGIDDTVPGAGAAGGAGFGMLLWGATLSPGSRAVGEALGLAQAVGEASVVITGEGRFDAQSDAGKVASYVLAVAGQADVPVMLIAGLVEADTGAFAAARSLTELGGNQAAALANTIPLIERAAAELATLAG